MVKRRFVQIILGAGRPFSGEQNSSLKKVSTDVRVLDWTLQAAKFLSPEVHFIAGYQMDEIVSRYPSLHYSVNTEWRFTGPIFSLLEARASQEADYIVSYGDILFRQKTVRELVDLDFDVGIAVDSKWRDRFSTRTLKDIDRSEKVKVSKGQLLAAGSDISAEVADAEFIGLMTLKPEVVRFLEASSESFPPDMRRANLGRLAEFLREHGFSIGVVDVEGDWAELNEPQDLASFILGTKAQSLKRLAEVITLSNIAPQVSFTVDDWVDRSDEIIDEIQSKFKTKKLIVRSSAISEDGFESSNAGAYVSVLHIDASVKKEISESIKSVIDSYLDGNPQNQVLIQPMIENVGVSGVVFTRTLSESAPYYVINYDDVSKKTDTITSGISNDHKTLIVSRKSIENLQSFVPDSLDGLIPAIHELESLLDFSALDIEFAISCGGDVHILQVRPLTADTYEIDHDELIFESIESCVLKFRNLQNNSPFVVGSSTVFGLMPDWNPAEIIGTNPNVLSFDLYRYLITDEVWATQRAEYGYRDVRPHPLLVSFSGHPYVDVRASFNSFIPATVDDELAERLTDFYILRLLKNPHYHDKVEFEVLPTCFSFDYARWAEILRSGGFSYSEIDELQIGLRTITSSAISRTQQDLRSVEIFRQRFTRIYDSNLPPLDKALSLLEDCRRYGTLVFAHLARSAFIAVTLLKSAADSKVISRAAVDSFFNSIETIAHEFINDAKRVADNSMSWSSFIDLYGHLRPGTYDITSEAYGDNIEKYLRPLVDQGKKNKIESVDKDSAWLQERGSFLSAIHELGITHESNSIERFLRDAIEGREYAKFVFTRNLSIALDLIAEYGKNQGLDRSQISNIPLAAFFELRSGNVSSADSFSWLSSQSASYSKLYEIACKIELPPLITAESDFKIFLSPISDPNYVGSGRVSAEVALLDYDYYGERESSLDQKIVLIPHADPGYDWIFGHNFIGLITMYGGGNSHMAIRANEFGIPAAIGVGETTYEKLSRAHIVELDVTNRKIAVIR